MSTGTDGLFWVALASPRNPLLDFLSSRHPMLRQLAWSLPEAVQPKPANVLWTQGIDVNGKVVHDVYLPSAGYHMVTGVREHAGSLYFSSLAERSIAVLPLSSRRQA